MDMKKEKAYRLTPSVSIEKHVISLIHLIGFLTNSIPKNNRPSDGLPRVLAVAFVNMKTHHMN